MSCPAPVPSLHRKPDPDTLAASPVASLEPGCSGRAPGLCRHLSLDLVDKQVKSAFRGAVRDVNKEIVPGVAHRSLGCDSLLSLVIKGTCPPSIGSLKSPAVLKSFRYIGTHSQ
jgi:hypothetical protein